MSAIQAWLKANADLATVTLVAMLLVAAWIMWKAQKRSDFDFAQMLLDEAGKPSALRLSIMGSFAISSWVVMHDTLDNTLTDWEFVSYLAVWSGAKVADTFAQKFGRKEA